jgi:hypothetical protein
LAGPAAATAFRRLTQLAAGWHEIEPGEAVRETAVRFLSVHTPRSAGALQLAAALTAAEGRLAPLSLVTLDYRMASAACKEGFAIAGLAVAE